MGCERWTGRTFFADERVVPVVGIVRVTKPSMRIFEFEKLVAVLARVTRAVIIIPSRRSVSVGHLGREEEYLRTSICCIYPEQNRSERGY
jgi:hypothetical protein